MRNVYADMFWSWPGASYTFSLQAGKQGCQHFHESLPLPLPPNVGTALKHTQCLSSQGQKPYIGWRRTGDFCAILSIFFCLLEKYNRHSFNTKRVGMPNWRAPWKGGVSTYFVAIFQVARNPLKFGMLTLFVSKNVPVFFFPQAGKRGFKHALESPHPPLPPPPPSNVVKHTHAQCFSSQGSESYNVWRRTQGGGGGGGFSCNLVHIFLPFEKKNGHFLTQKE